jgi:hypothetical protein
MHGRPDFGKAELEVSHLDPLRREARASGSLAKVIAPVRYSLSRESLRSRGCAGRIPTGHPGNRADCGSSKARLVLRSRGGGTARY